jgi:hypothetical protein
LFFLLKRINKEANPAERKHIASRAYINFGNTDRKSAEEFLPQKLFLWCSLGRREH